jgi:cytochrome c biogenesis protein
MNPSESTTSTAQAPSRRFQDAVELLSSMRFAIALLSVICIASVIGTVLKQHEPLNNYVNQFGPFWAEVFGAAGLFSVYSAWWFLLILAFLVVSTSLCIARNAPKILKDIQTFKEGVREQSLRAFPHRGQGVLNGAPEQALSRVQAVLHNAGFKTKVQARDNGVMVAAKAGSTNKLGYLAAHSAIVLVCIGGLLDGDLMIRAQMWMGQKTPFEGGGLIADVPAQHRLSAANPTFRGNLLVPEGATADTVILTQPTGVLLQGLPFAVELKKFVVEYYQTGMPKLFASDIIIHDKATGKETPARVEVNHPVSYQGVQIYQSSFDDGGSSLTLSARSMGALTKPFVVETKVGETSSLKRGDNDTLQLEVTGLRVINVENMGATASASATDVRSVNLVSTLSQHMGSGSKAMTPKTLQNVGPSFSYKLRDAAGQAKEFNNYMVPVDVDGQRKFLFGVRDTPSEPYRYLRIPADSDMSLDGFMRLKQDLSSPEMRALAVSRYVDRMSEGKSQATLESLRGSAGRALALFAGDDPELDGMAPVAQSLDGKPLGRGGLSALSFFLDANVPADQRDRVGETLVSMINAMLADLLDLGRERQGLAPWSWDDTQRDFLVSSVLALSDGFYYPAPMTFLLDDFKQVQASVFQVAKAPGKTIVYLGCLLLILGVFAMLYIREKRVWVWLTPEGANTHATVALSVNRKVLDVDTEFAALKRRLLEESA